MKRSPGRDHEAVREDATKRSRVENEAESEDVQALWYTLRRNGVCRVPDVVSAEWVSRAASFVQALSPCVKYGMSAVVLPLWSTCTHCFQNAGQVCLVRRNGCAVVCGP